MLPCSYSGDLHEEMPIRRTARVIAGRAAMSSGRAPECWLHGVHLPPKASAHTLPSEELELAGLWRMLRPSL